MRESIFDKVRALAKTSHYQTLYNSAKEIHLQIFQNIGDLSDLQVEFLNWLGFYSNLFLDLALGEITEIVFEHPIYEDAYSYYKRHKDTKDRRTLVDNAKMPRQPQKPGGNISWIFKNPKRK